MTDSKSRSPAPAAPDDEKEAVAWQLTVDGVPLWNEASFYRTDGDAMDALAEGDMGNGLIPLYLHPAGRSPAEVPPRPEIVCLCGSTRFMDAFFAEGWRLTLDRKIVLSVGVVKSAGPDGHAAEAIGQDVADRLDELHLRKIDLADRVLVLNVGGYIGSSTRKEIAYAERTGKPIEYLEPEKSAAVWRSAQQ